MANQRKAALVAGSKTRVQNESTEQTVKASAGVLHRIVVTNAAAAVGSITVTDGATTLGVYEVPQDDTRVLEFGCEMDTSIKVTPSATTIDALVVFD